MYSGRPVFARIMGHLPWHVFDRRVDRYGGDRYVKAFSCADRYRCMAFARLTCRSSPRDIGTCLRARSGKPCHMGIRGGVSRNAPANANRARDWRIHADFAQRPVHVARDAHADDALPGPDVRDTVYAPDSPTVDLCLSLFPRARFRKTKGAVRPHTLPGPHGNIPAFIHVSDGKPHGVNVLDMPVPEAGSFHVMDRACPGFARLHHLHLRGGFPVPGAKPDTRLRRLSSRPVDGSTGLVCDQAVRPDGINSATACPDRLRRIRYRDRERGRTPVFLTSSLVLPAMTVADIHRSRWRVELFFRWIRRHLRTRSFSGTSENAVKSRIRIAVSVYVIVAIIRKRTGTGESLHTILQIPGLTVFGKTPLNQLLDTTVHQIRPDRPSKRLNLFDF